ncbi:hypothetical protein Tsubulata_010944 [Turnera subulata]|uniref:Nucleolar 27S pre-rRNA processing Urb2/Npa2 C-terminal domain-containing protein n=1 Tax=Turnera subulata TaxID=218843 RepID=A0A9Q0J2W3_9ROSI|nr:hypothetical protein Tsubulata_010944 [Turnera subulata]
MAGSSSKKTKKRKLISPEEKKPQPAKTPRIVEPQNTIVDEGDSSKRSEFEQRLELGGPWRNLELILFLRNKQIDIQRKVEVAFNYVNSRAAAGGGEGNDVNEDCETVKMSRLIAFLSDWVQSLLISADKKIGGIEAALDTRCWVIFKFCLEKSLRLQVSLSLSGKLLPAIDCIARNGLSRRELVFVGEEAESSNVVLDCVSLMFSSQGRLQNENLDLWISTVRAVIELVCKAHEEKPQGADVGVLALRLASLVLEPFAKFLRAHPTQKTGKNVFRDFIEGLFEPLLQLLGVLHHYNGSYPTLARDLLVTVEEVLSQGLFHPIHVDGFLTLRGIEKYSASDDVKMKDSIPVIKSYHRHLFDKVERLVAAKKESVLCSLGGLFGLLVDRVKKQKGDSVLSEDTKMTVESGGPGQNSNVPPDHSHNNLNAERRKSLFDFLVHIMEPLLLEMDSHIQTKLEAGPLLFDVHCTIKSINNLLASICNGKLYVKTEDTTEGACLNFFKKIYHTIFLLATNLLCLPTSDIDFQMQEIVTLLARELIVSFGYILDIEYEVVDNNLTSLWLVMLSYLAFHHSYTGEPNQSLNSQILGLGCQLVKLYGELRQVKNALFSLSKAIRLILKPSEGDGELVCHDIWPCRTSIPYNAYAKSVRMLLCAESFKFAVRCAIKSIPEGQVSECIQQLSVDLSESLEWMKNSSALANGKGFGNLDTKNCELLSFDLQIELFGRGLSEMYSLVLDSLSATVGNSSLVGRSLKDLMVKIRPYMSVLVGQESDSAYDFLRCVTGRNYSKTLPVNKFSMLKPEISAHWVFVFFFRLYISCRCLYRQAVSLMPPDLSRKMSAEMADSYTSHCGRDWMERTDWQDSSYFSWIAHPSASLLNIIQLVSDICLQGGITDCCSLIYVLHVMAIQRLADLNRHINSSTYIKQNSDNVVQMKLVDDTSVSMHRKRSKKWGKHISTMHLEAASLTEFIMQYFPLLGDIELSDGTFNDENLTCEQTSQRLGACSMGEKSLLTAIWWIVCQNIDIWSAHASKKKLKMFLSRVINFSLPSLARNFTEEGKNNANQAHLLSTLCICQISSELLTDSVLYEHKFVCRYLASRFCHLLEKCILPMSSGHANLKKLPSWEEVSSELNELLEGVKTRSSSPDMPVNLPKELDNLKFTACQSLLGLLCWMPKGYMNSKSFSLYATYLLNLERLIIRSLLSCWSSSLSSLRYKLIKLFVSCRRALKNIIMEYCGENSKFSQSSPIPILSEASFSVAWLLKSVTVVVDIQERLEAESADECRDLVVSLMDHTSYVFLGLSKNICAGAFRSMIAEKPAPEQPKSEGGLQQSSSGRSGPYFDFSRDTEAWKSVLHVVETLKDQAQGLLISLKDTLAAEKMGDDTNVVNLNNLSAMISCFSGFLWGLASGFNLVNAADSDYKVKFLRWKYEPVRRINDCLNVFTEFIGFALHLLFTEDDHQLGKLFASENVWKPENNKIFLDSGEFTQKDVDTVMSCDGKHQKSESLPICLASGGIGGHSLVASLDGNNLQLEDANSIASVLNKIDSYEGQPLNKYLLQGLVKGDHPKSAILIRLLMTASSAFLRLNLQNGTPMLSGLVPGFIGISEILLLKLADGDEITQPLSFVWLDGVLRYLQELGSHLPSTNPGLTRNLYTKLIQLHLKALGKCISFQGKEATLASHEKESSTKILQHDLGSSTVSLSHRPYSWDDFKARLRMSFKVLIRKPSELHLLSSIQAIERALVGVHEGFTVLYEINTGSGDGGKISSIVAAGIDCLDLILEYVSGRKRLNVVKRHIQSLVAALFNIILHLQSLSIFHGSNAGSSPDPGAAILMCVEVLTRVCGKQALFEMDSWHIAQSLHIPAALFTDFSQPRFHGCPALCNSLTTTDNDHTYPLTAMSLSNVGRQFPIKLFGACCRLLYTIVKHHKSETERCVALLQESTCVLLNTLETVDASHLIQTGDLSWKVKEGVKCACFLRRIYEELRQQKDVFGRHCFKFLCNYIWVYSGYGPLKIGIKREIDEALKPGVYALMDACSAEDLQYLHSAFGEGPCRNTMATLQHDYKLNFQYEGKV